MFGKKERELVQADKRGTVDERERAEVAAAYQLWNRCRGSGERGK